MMCTSFMYSCSELGMYGTEHACQSCKQHLADNGGVMEENEPTGSGRLYVTQGTTPGTPPAKAFPRPGTQGWSVMNRRRGDLIRKHLLGTLTSAETAEYEYLQKESLVAIEEAFPYFSDDDEAHERELEERLKRSGAHGK